MITIDSPYLATTAGNYTAAHLTEVALAENNYAPLVVVDFGEVEVLAVDAGEEITLPEDWESVRAIASNGQTFTPAENPESPQAGEFVCNPYTNTVRVYGSYGRSLQIYGLTRSIKFSPPLLSPPYPALFTNLPLQGTIQISRSFEQQPSAQFELESTLPKSQLQAIFTPGGELELYGIPLRINSVSITELPRAIYPDARCQLSVSLGGKWENYNEPVFLRSNGKNDTPNDTPFQDADCLIPSGASADTFYTTTTVPALLKKAGIPYSGPTLAVVDIDKGTRRDAAVNPVGLLEERVRVANSFIRWSSAAAVEAVPISGLRVWEYQEHEILGEVTTSYEAIAKTSKKAIAIPNLNPPLPDLTNFPSTVTAAPIPTLKNELPTALGFEYPNSELSGKFQETRRDQFERTQGQSQLRYVRKEPTKTTRIEGDAEAHVPLEGVESIQVMSLCFDAGGQTKTRTTVYEEDGATIYEIDEIWGFAYIAREIYDDSRDRLNGDPNQYWQCLKQTRTDYTYDLATGYFLYTYTSGYNTVRYRQESAESPETLGLDPDDSEYELYQFIRIPVVGRNSNKLRLDPNYTTEGLSELTKICNRDGTSTLVPVINPNFAPDYYVEEQRQESVAFASRPNPENEGVVGTADDPLLPDLIVGEESRFEKKTQITPAIYQQILTGSNNGYPTSKQGQELTAQQIVDYIKQFKAQGPSINQALEETSIERSTGDPPVAQRKPAVYEQEQAKNGIDAGFEPTYKYYLQTAGYTIDDPVNGSENFSVAETLEEALTAAKCKAAIENWRNGFSENLQIAANSQIKEGDRFNYWCNGEYRKRIVLSAQTPLNILGTVNGQPKVTGITTLTLGRWMLPNVNYVKIPMPTASISNFNVVNQTLGGVLDWTRVRSRRNPNPSPDTQ
ncbi:MAG: hypothetical protein RMY28_009450 [Nostoc sp. ChiSLP01]|nr:hypothetical protein [Nostoc sp. CmiSLP01]MDZ8285220.1 hypothetical protein [Nostoc sp. ChiSLP01]